MMQPCGLLGNEVGNGGAVYPFPVESCALLDGVDDHLSRTVEVEGDRQKYRLSLWVKRCRVATDEVLFCAALDSETYAVLQFLADGTLAYKEDDGTVRCDLVTSRVFRDVTHHYHLSIAVDTTQATAAGRVTILVNGAVINDFATEEYYEQDFESAVNAATAEHRVGSFHDGTLPFGGYLSEYVLQDGTTNDTGGQFSARVPGLWVPKQATGNYGTNGFRFDFADVNDLGLDVSGTGNHMTVAGAPDGGIDTPTANWATLNPLAALESGTPGLSNGNLTYTPGSQNYCCPSWFGMESGKWYWEVSFSAIDNASVGVTSNPNLTRTYVGGSAADTGGGYHKAGRLYQGGSYTAYGETLGADDVVRVFLDMDAGALWYALNDELLNEATLSEIESGDTTNAALTGLAGTLFPATSGGSDTFSYDFGQHGYAYTPPEGFLPLCDASRFEPTMVDSSKYAHASTFVASGEDVTVTLGFDLESSDFLVNLANLTTAEPPRWFDSVVALERWKLPRTNAAWTTEETPCSVSGTDLTIPADWLSDGDTYSLFILKACVETGFEIQVVTNTNGDSAVLDHGLGRVPQLAMVNPVEGGGTAGIVVYHEDIGEGAFTHFGGAATATRGAGYWPLTTATQFQLPDYDADEWPDGEIAVYLFCSAEFGKVVTGITGNGSADGPYVDMGGRLLCLAFQKCASSTTAYLQYNLERAPVNPVGHSIWLGWSSDLVEQTSVFIEPASTGYKMVEAGNTTNKAGGVSIAYGVLAQTKYKNAF